MAFERLDMQLNYDNLTKSLDKLLLVKLFYIFIFHFESHFLTCSLSFKTAFEKPDSLIISTWAEVISHILQAKQTNEYLFPSENETTWFLSFLSALLSNINYWAAFSPALPIDAILYNPDCSLHLLKAIKGGKLEKENWNCSKTNMRSKERIENFFYLFACMWRVEERIDKSINYLTLHNTTLISFSSFFSPFQCRQTDIEIPI